MNLGLVAAVLIGAVAAMVALMLFVRCRATAGGYFKDSDRASSVFSYVGAGFAIMLGIVVLLTFDAFSHAEAQAEREATAVFEQYEVAVLFNPAERREVLWGELVCYGRSVVASEWPAMKDGNRSTLTDGWIETMEQEVPAAHITTMSDSTAYEQWFNNAAIRDDARRQRLLAAQETLPTLLWIMLIIGAVSVVGFVLFYADPEERVVGQVAFIGSITAVVVVSLLAVALLASPFRGGDGSIKPTSMQYTLELIEHEAAKLGEPLKTPCNATGAPV